ncbi:MAG: hypothetical protein DRP45_12400 [Candidatus Zixiibacteriota bacterium]|nr:MAG: hypothetical protein DRP45_12400 [candidate division Zixibacteria bacterium]
MYTRTLSIAVICLLMGCSGTVRKTDSASKQGVAGTVWKIPDYDASDMSFINDPPDLTPRPLPSVKVHLIPHSDQSIGNVNSRDILATAVSDSLGHYRLMAPADVYFLIVGTVDFPVVVLQHAPGDSVGLDFAIYAYSVIEIPAGRIIEHDLKVHELCPQ